MGRQSKHAERWELESEDSSAEVKGWESARKPSIQIPGDPNLALFNTYKAHEARTFNCILCENNWQRTEERAVSAAF